MTSTNMNNRIAFKDLGITSTPWRVPVTFTVRDIDGNYLNTFPTIQEAEEYVQKLGDQNKLAKIYKEVIK